MLDPGTQLGRYKVRQPLGAGGMGEVYLAFDPALERNVAVKVLPLDFSEDAKRLERFVTEARAASALNHPNILTVYEIGFDVGIHFLATEFVDGKTLRDWMQEHRLGLDAVLDVGIQTASALAAAHRAGIVHRDIKPENLMRRDDGYIKVLDFGLAKLTSPADSGIVDSSIATRGLPGTEPGLIIGTVRYMSPEQASGLPVDARTDLWSLGVVLFELIAGRLPFEAPTQLRLILEIIGKDAPSLDAFAPDAPPELARIVGKALTKDLAERYQKASELVADLKKLQEELRYGSRRAASDELRGESMAPAAQAPPAAPATNLPPAAPELIGRERELGEVVEILSGDDVRLLTLTGIGGTGKTSLAQKVAHDLLPQYADGAFLVDLAPLSDPELVTFTAAQTLGIKETGGRAIVDALKDYLREKQMLLVFDNFEHVAAAAPLVGALLSSAPRIKAMVTSRAALHLSTEHEFSVPPLGLPSASDRGREASLEELQKCAAVALFVERAATARLGFALTRENAKAVAEICCRLDGIPLAIELAAARVKLFSPQALQGRLEHRLKLLTGGARDLPERQQTMRGAVQWSYDLLEAGERELLCRLAVFASGCDLEAAEAVCAEAGLDVFDGIASLVDKSLLRQWEQENGESRFRMLDLVREFALEQLEANGWAASAHGEHARYFLRLAEESAPGLLGTDEHTSLAKLTPENDNLRAALAHLLERSPEDGIRLVAALGYYWYARAQYREGKGWVERVLEAEGAASPARAWILLASARLGTRLGDDEGAWADARDCLAMARALGARETSARALNSLGILATLASRRAEARVWFEEGLAIAREVNDPMLGATFLTNLGELARADGDYAAAARYYEESLEADGPQRFTTGAGLTLMNLGAVRFEVGDLDGAAVCYRDAVEISRHLGNTHLIALGLDGLAAIALERGRSELAARLAGAAEAEYESLGALPEDVDAVFRERYVQKLEATLEPEALERAWARGRSMGLEAAVAEALQSD